MRRAISIGAGAVVAAVLTHGMVDTAVNFEELPPLPVWTYDGFFQHILLATERLWSAAHGWPPMSHIRDFGSFYAPAIELICPVVGFAIFRALSRHKVAIQFWKPLTIAVLFAMAGGLGVSSSRSATPWVEAARSIVIVLLMVWSVGAIRLSKRHRPIADSTATA